ncbi:Kelch-type beta propeller [Penicillium angulare]|uniref:Kelch-type beta propeller n=1 Tax=Penicillium angulare TaxID=116970 RepID=UPI0025405BE9|nr:Kelch-type beta propeller [Penicillium angulare]KAJ5266977.1 Kelch-type beta propeller [Penicillium angulare]
MLYMVGLDGGLIPGDEDSNHHYLMTLDLTSSFSVNDGSNYKLTIINDTVPDVKYQAFWPSRDNSTLYMYGGMFLNNVSTDTGIWAYSPNQKVWQILEQEIIIPTRLVNGANTNAPQIQAAYWVGGYQDSDTTVTITDSTVNYAKGMIQLNTTTGIYTSLEAPFTPVQDGSLSYIPVGEMGILVYVGGEIPSIQDGINATLVPNKWDYVQVYDIAKAKWYNQTTSGSGVSRTQYCASVQHDESSSSYEIFFVGGADFETEDVITDVSYLSIPSFKWYQASPVDTGRMTMDCATYGSQIFGVGGRLAWYVDERAGCYKMPAFIYDAESQAIRTDFDPTRTAYSVSASTYDDIKKSPYPSKWADSNLKALFVAANTNKSSTNSTSTAKDAISSSNSSTNTGAIVGGVVGGVAGLIITGALVYFCIFKHRKNKKAAHGVVTEKPSVLIDSPARAGQVLSELWDAKDPSELGGNGRSELASRRATTRFELAGK